MNLFKHPGEPASFYIGWQPKVADEYRRFGRVLIITLLVVCCIIAWFIVSNQRGFSSGVYERNHETELEGMLQLNPFPAIKTFYGKDIYGNPVVKTIPLVNFGKFGADPIIEKISSEHNNDLNALWVKVKGKLEYNHGAALLELSAREKSIESVSAISKEEKKLIAPAKIQELGLVTLHGQIVDPKCYLGVMKPAEGKPHSDCAIRCIAGGIQPMFVIRNEKGEETFFILRGEKGEPVNEKILCDIGIPVEVSGKLSRVDDWLVLYVNPEKGINVVNGE
ncbi:MAG TPA: hypothetical protein VE978_14810 [Chitinophagales bacterium]|nr:hypothetical protein [Chitinophagales bacterium]